MIQIEQLTKRYGSSPDAPAALENVDIQVEKGDIYGIIGMSGAGKSTLLRCIATLELPTAGRILFEGEDITSLQGEKLRAHRKSVGIIFQGYNLLMQQTVWKNVAFPLELGKMPREKVKARVDQLLELVGLTDKALAYPSQLSGGQKQRVAIARALANDSKVMLCDEPTSALDLLTTRSILDLLVEINSKLGVTVLIITHEIGVVRAICTKVAVLDGGRVVESGGVSTVFASPQSGVTKQILLLEGGLVS